MQTEFKFPVVDERPLLQLGQLYEAFPDLFERADCPYGTIVKELYTGTVKANDFDGHSTTSLEDISDDSIEKNITGLYDKLEDYWHEVQNSDKSADKNTYFRVAVALMEKLVTLREKINDRKNATLFMGAVMGIMDDIMTSDQRNEVMQRLEAFK